MRRSLTVLFVAMTAALACVVPAEAEGAVASAAAGCIKNSGYEVCFNNPRSSDAQKRGVIFRRLRKMINRARKRGGKRDEIRVAMFAWDAGVTGCRARSPARAVRART